MPAHKENICRYERKFLVSELTAGEIEALVKLHPAMFREQHLPRFVNNVYFDSYDLKSYLDSVDGVDKRMKCRIRWYGDLFGVIGKPTLEIKAKEGSVNKKIGFPMPPLRLGKHFRTADVKDAVSRSGAPDLLKNHVMSLEGTLLNRYRRKYFVSTHHECRITIECCPIQFRYDWPRTHDSMRAIL